MGEAKRAREIAVAEMLAVIDSWSSPASPREAVICAELATLEVVEIPRASQADMTYMKMVPRECHANCIAYAKLDPDRLSDHVLGWIPWPEAYVLHSVIRREGELFCVTPILSGAKSSRFIVDDRLSLLWKSDLGAFGIARDGKLLDFGAGVRKNPEETIQHMTGLKERLLNGEHPSKIMDEMGF